MSKVYIEYNPYTIETIFKIDDEEVKSQSILNKKDKRLQYYIEADEKNWEGLIKELIKIINSKNIDIEFKGRKIDYDDLEYSISKYKQDNQNVNFNLKHIKSKEDEDIHKNFCELIEKIQNSSIKELQNTKLQDCINEGISTDFKMSVLSNTSSGKSTFINALIGNDLLPSSNKSCTATIARIRDNDNKNDFTIECRDQNENIVYDKRTITFDKESTDDKITTKEIEKYNRDEKVRYIDIEGSIPGISSDKMNLVLQDIPISNKTLNYNIDTIIDDKNKGIVLYIIDVTETGTKYDKELLEKISKAMKSEGKQSRDRFIFVVNKSDRIDIEKESLSEILEEIKDDLKKDYDIKNPNIFLISSNMAKLIRMKKQGINLTMLEEDFFRTYEDYIEYEELHFDKLSTLSQSSKFKLEEKLNKAKENCNKYEEALIHTGIPAIEISINEYLEKYVYPIKIKKSIKETKNFIEEIIKKLEYTLSEDRNSFENRENIRNQIDDLKKNINKVEVLKDKINKFISYDLQLISNKLKLLDMKEKLNNLIDENKDIINNKSKVEKNEFQIIVTRIKLKLNDFEKNSFKELKEFFYENILKECKLLLKEYYKYIKSLGYDKFLEKNKFHKIVKLKNANIKDIDTLIHQYKKNEDYINIEEVINPKLRDFQEIVIGNIEIISNLSKECIKVLQSYFKEQIEDIDEYIQPEIEKLDKLTNNYEKIDNDLKQNQDTLRNMNDINRGLEELLEIQIHKE